MNAPTLSALSLVFDYVLRASLLGTVAIALVILIRWTLGRRLAPGARSWLWLPAAVLCLSPQLPGLVDWGVTARRPAPAEEVMAVDGNSVVIVRGEPQPLLGVPAPMPTAPAVRLSLKEKMALSWAAGSATILLFWLVAYAGLWRRIRRQQMPLSEGLAAEYQVCTRIAGFKRAPRLMVSAAVESPAVAGLWRPVVLMPPHLATALGDEALRHVLLHELTHLRRKDLWLHWASALVVALHWFNPFVWLASRKFRGDREAACDATVIHLGENRAHAYGQTLLALESRVMQPVALRLMAGVLGGADLVRQRIVDIAHLGKTSRRAGWFAFVATLGGAAVIALAAAEPVAPKVEPPKPADSKPANPSAGFFTRTYKVPPEFLTWNQLPDKAASSENTVKPTAIEVLKGLGVPFPEGASAAFIPSSSLLIARNTQANHDLVEAIVEGMLSHPGKQVYIQTRLVVFKEGTSLPSPFDGVVAPPTKVGSSETPGAGGEAGTRIMQGTAAPPKSFMTLAGVFTDPQFQVLLRSLMGNAAPDSKVSADSAMQPLKGFSSNVEEVIGLPSVTTRSGHKAVVEVVRELVYPSEFDRKEPAKQGGAAQYTAKTFETRSVGFILETEPVIGPDGYTIDLNLSPKMLAPSGWVDYPLDNGEKIRQPVFHTNVVQTSVTVWDGQTIALGGHAYVPAFLMNPSLQGESALLSKEYPVLIFVTVTMVDPKGQPVKKEDVPEGGKVNTPGAAPASTPLVPSPKKASASHGKGTSRARIDVGSDFMPPHPNRPDDKFTADFVGTQIELLRSPRMLKRAEERMKIWYPDVKAVPVNLTAERVRDTTQVEIFASAAENPVSAGLFLDCLLDEMAAFRQQTIKDTVYGTLDKVLNEVFEKQNEVNGLVEALARATRENASQQKRDEIQADLDRVRGYHREWKEKLEQVERQSLPLRMSLERSKPFTILERPISMQAEEK